MPLETARRACVLGVVLVLCLTAAPVQAQEGAGTQPQNIVLIVSDDHRYDFMGFHPEAPDFLDTPGLDRMAREGLHLANAFVTTSLCSPSRASILTGQYAHTHGVVDNSTPVPEGTRFFPQDLQEVGYATAFIGKWHMGAASDDPRPGFDHWVSFRGQGVYYDPVFNVNGERVERDGYMTDLLTDYALDWLEGRSGTGGQDGGEEPFFMVLSHKAVHAEFEPAPRHRGRLDTLDVPRPPSMANTASNYAGKPRWVREQRYSWHGVDYMYHGQLTFDPFYRRYAETLLALDESVGRVLDYLEASGLAESTLVIYLGDNGFLLGEHGLIDKRNAYEESIRIPMLAWAPGYVAPGARAEGLVRNIDVAPTLLELAGASTDIDVEGTSFLPMLEGDTAQADAAPADTSRAFLYEYYWEHAFPHTPTTLALRTDRYKYIYYHGIWDTNELYDLEADPREQHNLIDVPAYEDVVERMRTRLFDRLEAAGALRVPLRRGAWQADERLLHEE